MANGLLLKNGLIVTGSVEIQSTVSASSFSGDGSGLSGVSDFPYTGSAIISGSLEVVGNTNFTGSINFLNNSSNKIVFENAASITQPQIRLRTHNTGITMRGNDVLALLSNGSGMIGIKKTGIAAINFPSNAQVGFTFNTSVESYQPYLYFHRYSGNTIGIGVYGGSSTANTNGRLILQHITASGHVSASTYYGDGSNLTGISSDPFPYTGSAEISGSLDVNGPLTIGGSSVSKDIAKLYIVGDGGRGGYIQAYADGNGSRGLIIGPHASGGSSGGVRIADNLVPNGNLIYNLGSDGVLWTNTYTQRVRSRNNHAQGDLFLQAGHPSRSLYLQDGNQSTALEVDDIKIYSRRDVEITGSNSLSGNYALKVTNTSGADILKAENDGKLYLRNPSHTSGDINSTGSIVHYGDLTLGPITSNAPDRKLTIAGYDGAQVEFNLHNGWGKPTIEAHYGGTIKYINYGNNSTNLNFQFGESATRQGSMRFYTNSDEAIKFGTNTGYPLAYIGVVEQPNNYNGGLVIKSRNGTTQINTWTFGRYGDLDAPGNISASGHVSASTYYGDGSNLTGISSDPFPYTGSAIISGSLSLEGSGSTIFDVVGSQGQLFSITDSLSGSLFAVSDITGLPILEVFSDDTVKIGSFNNEAIIVSGSNATITGSFTGSFTGDGSNLTGIETDPFPYTGSAIISGSLEVIGTQRSLYTTASIVYDGSSNITQITSSFEGGGNQITNINYTGSNVDNIVISGSDGINKIYTLSYDGSGNVTQIIVS